MTSTRISRRSMTTSLGLGGLALAAARSSAVAQQTGDMASHAMVGIWLGITPEGPAPAFFNADGSFLGSSSPISAGEDGSVSFSSPQNGVWEPDPENERGIHFTSVQSTHDATGALTGTVTVDGYPAASEDGESFYDDAKRARVTIRDAANNVVAVLGEDGSLPPVYGIRMHPGEPRFHDGTPPG